MVVLSESEFNLMIETLEGNDDVRLYDEAKKKYDGERISFDDYLQQRKAKKMNRFSAAFLLLLTTCSSYCQEITLYGRVINRDKSGLSFCSVEIPGKDEGVVTDKEGKFRIAINIDSVRSLIFFAMGYERAQVNIKDAMQRFPDSFIVVQLAKANVGLNEVSVVSHRKERKKLRILGKQKLKQRSGCYMQYGEEVAIYLQAEPDIHDGYLKKIFFYITDEGAPTSRFKVNVYNNNDDTALFEPGKNLLDNTYARGTHGNEWVSIDVSDRHIPIKGGIFVGMEWVADSNSKQEFEFQDPQGWHICGSARHDEGIHYGQVMGTTWGYGVLSWTFVRDHSGNYEWKHRYTIFQDERNNFFDQTNHFFARLAGYYGQTHHWFNPMIYCTYTYSKK